MPPSTPPPFSWQTGTVAAEPGRHRTRVRRRWLLTGAAAVAGAAAAAVLVATLPGNTSPGGAGAAPVAAAGKGTSSSHAQARGSAPALLLAAARTSLSVGDPVLAAGQYRYIRTVGPTAPTVTSPGTGPEQVVPAPAGSYSLDELWIPKNQTDVWMRRSSTAGDPAAGPGTVWTGKCGDLYANAQDGPKGDPCTRQGSFDDLTPAFVAALPRNAGALLAQLRTYAAPRLNPDKIHDINYLMFRTVNDMLMSGMPPSDLRSALYSVLSRIPGIKVVPGAKNAAGVPGTGFQLSSTLGRGSVTTHDTLTLIVDTATGAYLGFHEKSPPDVDYSDAVTVGVADRIGTAGH